MRYLHAAASLISGLAFGALLTALSTAAGSVIVTTTVAVTMLAVTAMLVWDTFTYYV